MAQTTSGDLSTILTAYFSELKSLIEARFKNLALWITDTVTINQINAEYKYIYFKIHQNKVKLISDVNSHIDKLQKQLDKKNNEVNTLQKSIQHLKNESMKIHAAVDEQKNLQWRVNNLKNELTQAQQQNQQYMTQIGELQEQMGNKNNEVDKLQKSIQHLENESMKIHAAVDEQQSLQLRVNHLERESAQTEKNQEYKSQIDELQEQMDKKVGELNELIKQLQTENTEFRQQKDVVVGEEKISQSRLRIDHLEKELLHAQSNQQSVYAELRRMLAVIQASMPHGDELPEIRHVPSWENLVGSLEQVLGQGQEIHFKRMSDDSVKMYVQSPMPYKSEESTHAKIMQMLAILWPECRKMSNTMKTMIEGKENELEELCTAHSVMNKRFDELVKGLRQWPLRFVSQEKHIPNNSLPSQSTEDEDK